MTQHSYSAKAEPVLAKNFPPKSDPVEPKVSFLFKI